MASTLSRWLATLDPPRLAALLARRPEALTEPVPRTLGELAGRLQGRFGVASAFQSVPLPAVQVLEAALAFGCHTRADLAALLGEDGLDDTLATLAGRALMWEYDGQLAVAGEVATGLGYPLRLGPPAGVLLSQRTVAELRGIAAALDLPTPAQKKSLLRELDAFYADPDGIRALVASAPHDAREILGSLAWHGPATPGSAMAFGGPAGRRTLGPDEWAVRHGLLSPDGWQRLLMPREVALALRGPGWRPPFDPRPPSPPLRETSTEAVAREAAAAAAALLDQVGALLATGPLAQLKAGGVGAREQRRLAKLLGTGEAEVRLAIELAWGAGLLATTPDEVLPTEAYDQWAAAEPAERLPPLLVAWCRLPAASWRDGAALSHDPDGRLLPDLRLELLVTAADLPAAGGVTDPSSLVAAVRWRAPVLVDALTDPAGLITPLWAEAGRLGLVAHGTLSPLGRALVAMDADGLGQAARALLDAANPTAIFQADLTAVVPGSPTARLVGLLDGAAEREARGAASTWRFTADSVRRALDAGTTGPQLIDELRAAASGGVLPQALEYLITDVARRHGQLRVRSVGCVLHAADSALLAELLASRALRPLRLRELAPTVLASAASCKDTLAALRAAGYAPVREDASGDPQVERAERRRAPAQQRHRLTRRATAPQIADPATLAAALLATPQPVARQTRPGSPGATAPERALRLVEPLDADPLDDGPPDGGELAHAIARHAAGLSADERRLLAHAIECGEPVRIAYVDGDGRATVRVIEDIELVGGSAIEAWCQLREDDRMFLLNRIEAVAPA